LTSKVRNKKYLYKKQIYIYTSLSTTTPDWILNNSSIIDRFRRRYQHLEKSKWNSDSRCWDHGRKVRKLQLVQHHYSLYSLPYLYSWHWYRQPRRFLKRLWTYLS
jgi:hypothetical protein